MSKKYYILKYPIRFVGLYLSQQVTANEIFQIENWIYRRIVTVSLAIMPFLIDWTILKKYFLKTDAPDDS